MIVYVVNSTNLQKATKTSEFNKVAGYNRNIQNLTIFLHTSNE